MELSFERIYKELSQEEGVIMTKYKCSAGHWTVGVGHNLDAEGIDDIIGRVFNDKPMLTGDELKKVFQHDLNKVTADLDRELPWWRDQPVFSQYVLISLVFNMGIGKKIKSNPDTYTGFLGFRNTIKSFTNQSWKGVAYGLTRSRWYKQVGNRGKKLVGIIATGTFPDGQSE
jgi:lysozyme